MKCVYQEGTSILDCLSALRFIFRTAIGKLKDSLGLALGLHSGSVVDHVLNSSSDVRATCFPCASLSCAAGAAVVLVVRSCSDGLPLAMEGEETVSWYICMEGGEWIITCLLPAPPAAC